MKITVSANAGSVSRAGTVTFTGSVSGKVTVNISQTAGTIEESPYISLNSSSITIAAPTGSQGSVIATLSDATLSTSNPVDYTMAYNG